MHGRASRRELRGAGHRRRARRRGGEAGAECGNLLARMPGTGERTILLCAHVDTVAVDGPIEPVSSRRACGERRDDAILGADNKAAVAVMLAAARRAAAEPPPVGLELLFTVSEENALAGAKAFDASRLRSRLRLRVRPRVADRRDRARLADLLPHRRRVPRRAGARRDPPGGGPQRDRGRGARRSPRCALGRLDDETTANVGAHRRAADRRRTSSPTAACSPPRRARSTEARVEERRRRDGRPPAGRRERVRGATSTSTSQRLFTGYRHRPAPPAGARGRGRAARDAATSRSTSRPAAARTPTRSRTAGFPCTNLANGTERNHQPDERVARGGARGDARRDLRAAATSARRPSRRDALAAPRRASSTAGPADGGWQRLVVEVDGERRPALGRREPRRAVRGRRRRRVNVAGRRPRLGSGGFDIVHVNLTRGLAGEPGSAART